MVIFFTQKTAWRKNIIVSWYFHGPCKKKFSATTVNNEGIQIEFKDENQKDFIVRCFATVALNKICIVRRTHNNGKKLETKITKKNNTNMHKKHTNEKLRCLLDLFTQAT